MIPVSLTIKGLYSYQEEQVIDFTKLTEAQLFGIFGTVGSGKSSILEAISFALYSDTERLNKSGDNRNYNMLNLKSSELLIDFTFLNHDEQFYRFVVKGRRNGNNFEDVGTFRRTAYKLNGTIPEPLPETTAEAIIGLSYENFRRTIIIPQGKFQEFLGLTDSERTKMLKDIFQLEKFEFSRQTASLEHKNDAAMQELSGRLNQLGEVTEAAVQEKAGELTKLTEQHDKAKTRQQALELQEAESSVLQKKFEDRKEKQGDLKTMQDQQAKNEALKIQVERYEYANLHFKALFENENTLNRNKLIKQEEKQKAGEKLKTIQESLDRDEPKLAKVTDEHKHLENFQKEKAEFEILLNIKAIELQIELKKEEQNKVNERLEPLEKLKQGAEQQFEAKKTEITSVRSQQTDLVEMTQIQTWYTNFDNIQEQLAQVQKESDGLQQQMQEAKAQLTSLIPDELTKRLQVDTPDMLNQAILERESQNLNTLKQLTAEMDHLRLQSQLVAYAEQIEDGAPCPLCGSMEHPQVLEAESVDAEMNKLTENKQVLEAEKDRLVKLRQDLALAQAAIQSREEQQQSVTKRLETLGNNQKEHLKLFVWKQFTPENKDLFVAAWHEATQKQAQLKSLEAERDELETKVKHASENVDQAKQQSTVLETDLKVLQVQVSTYKNQMQQLDATVFVLDVETIREKRDELESRITRIQKEFSTLTEQVQQNNIALATAKVEEQTADKNLQEIEQELTKIDGQLAQILEKSPFTDRNEITEILQTTLDPIAIREQLTRFEQRLSTLQQELVVLNKELEGKSFDSEAYEALKNKLIAQKAEVEQFNTKRIEADTLHKRLHNDWETKKSIQTNYEKLELRKNNIQTLKRLFQASGFVNYISSVYLQQLCEAANERFHKLTRQQLRLELAENNSFQVRDFLNEGRTRSAKTLSGGQTFQASLCLALALAESIPQQSKAKQNFFFLDEGFGSQDKESLRLVFESLKALRQENRMVGVISHVEELQQEIDTYLTITNDPEKGSLVTGSWEN